MTREATIILAQNLRDICESMIADIRKQKTIAADYVAAMNKPENDRRQNDAK